MENGKKIRKLKNENNKTSIKTRKKEQNNSKNDNQVSKKDSKSVEKKRIQVISISVFALLIFLVILLLGTVLYMNLLPLKYLLILFLVSSVLIGGLSFFLLYKRIKNKIKIVSIWISILFIVVFLLGQFYLFRTMNFLGNLRAKNYKIETYHVIVLKDSDIKTESDLEKRTIGYNNSLLSGLQQAIDHVQTFTQKEITEYQGVNHLLGDIYIGKIDAIILEDSYKSSLEEESEEFVSKVHSIYHFDIKTDTEEIVKYKNVKDDTFNIYISGMDRYGSISSVSNSDVNILVTINPTTHQVLLTNIPRDYYVQLHGTTGTKDKLTHAGTYGIDMSIKTLEDLLDVDINYYVKVNFSSLINIVDALGGVDVYSEYTFDSEIGYIYYKGYNHMNGAQALGFARDRHHMPGGDRDRGKNQQAVIAAIIKKACSPTIITRYNDILNSLEGSFETNMPSNQILELVKMQLEKMPSWNITTTNLDGTGDMQPTYSYGKQELWVMQPDEKTVDNAKEMIQKVVDGKTLDSSYGDVSNIKNPTIVPPKEQPSTPPEENDDPVTPPDNSITDIFPDDPITDLLPDNPLPPEDTSNPTPETSDDKKTDPDEGGSSNGSEDQKTDQDQEKTDPSLDNQEGNQTDEKVPKPSE